MPSDKPFRLLPAITEENAHFWHGGAEGALRFQRCRDCAHLVHPPAPRCPECLSAELEIAEVSGHAELLTYTINHQPWIPGFDPPYVIAIVAIEEQPSLRLTTNVVNCPEGRLEIGMRLRVIFEEREDGIFLPLFEPAEEA